MGYLKGVEQKLESGDIRFLEPIAACLDKKGYDFEKKLILRKRFLMSATKCILSKSFRRKPRKDLKLLQKLSVLAKHYPKSSPVGSPVDNNSNLVEPYKSKIAKFREMLKDYTKFAKGYMEYFDADLECAKKALLKLHGKIRSIEGLNAFFKAIWHDAVLSMFDLSIRTSIVRSDTISGKLKKYKDSDLVVAVCILDEELNDKDQLTKCGEGIDFNRIKNILYYPTRKEDLKEFLNGNANKAVEADQYTLNCVFKEIVRRYEPKVLKKSGQKGINEQKFLADLKTVLMKIKGKEKLLKKANEIYEQIGGYPINYGGHYLAFIKNQYKTWEIVGGGTNCHGLYSDLEDLLTTAITDSGFGEEDIKFVDYFWPLERASWYILAKKKLGNYTPLFFDQIYMQSILEKLLMCIPGFKLKREQVEKPRKKIVLP